MRRTASWILRGLSGCAIFAVGAAIAVTIYLRVTDTDVKLTQVRFSIGHHVHAQTVAPMAKMDTAKPPAPVSTSLTLTIAGKTTTLSLADLKAMPQKSVKVHNEHTRMDETYTGVPLGDLLALHGFKMEPTNHRTMLRSYVKAEGTDKYWVLYSLTEVESSEHNGDVLVATSMDGKDLGTDGQLKLISTEDKKPQRWVRNLAAITVISAE